MRCRDSRAGDQPGSKISDHAGLLDGANRLGMSEAWDDPTVDDGKDRPVGFHRGVGGLVEDASYLPIASGVGTRWLFTTALSYYRDRHPSTRRDASMRGRSTTNVPDESIAKRS
jgi:hypothetical protein